MSRSWRISLVAGIVAVALVAIAIPRDAAESTHDLHQHYRVELDRPPVEAALWFANRYPSYFTSGEAELRSWLDGLEPRQRDFVIAMGQTLTWAWIEHELAGFEQQDPIGLAHEATAVIRHKTLNQLDLNADQYPDVDAIEFNAFVDDREFAAGVFARLVRGVSNCEGQNHLLALLLDTALEPKNDAILLGIQPGHELVRLQGPTLAQPVYVDAWSNLPAFTLDSLDDLGESPPPVVPGASGQSPFSASIYAEGHEDAVELLVLRDAPTKPVDLDIRAPALDEASLARVKDPWKLYLFARILHVYDDPRAGDLYRLVLERHCGEGPRLQQRFVCAASLALLERLET